MAAEAARVEPLSPAPLPKGEVAAICAADAEGVFLAYVSGVGFKRIDLSVEPARWTDAGRYTEPVAADLGLQASPAAAEGQGPRASVVSATRREWLCLQLPAAAGEKGTKGEAELAGRSELPAEALAVAAAAPGDAAAAAVLRTGAVRFYDLQSGQACGKGVKAGGPVGQEDAVAMARLGPGRAILVRAARGGEGLRFFVVDREAEPARAVCTLRGAFQEAPEGRAMRGLVPSSLQVAAAGGAAPGRVVLLWRREGEGPGHAAASAETDREAAVLQSLDAASVAAAKPQPPVCRLCVAGYLAELTAQPGARAPLRLAARDARYGMEVAAADVELTAHSKGVLVATAGSTTLLVALGAGPGQEERAAAVAAVRWSLPEFTLHMMVGREASRGPVAAGAGDALAPLLEVASGKRPREDPGAQELFSSAKRRATTDRALAAALKERRCAPSRELVEEVARRECWASAKALLALPELDDHLAARLLRARPELLARVVRRARCPRLLDAALQGSLSQADLPGILETLLEWLEAYRNFAEATVREAAPGVPPLAQVVTFLQALADGCLAALSRLDQHLLERVAEALRQVQSDARKSEQIRSIAQAAQSAPSARRRSGAKVELMLLDF